MTPTTQPIEGPNSRATLRSNYAKRTIARELLNDLVKEHRRDDNAGADERSSRWEKRDKDCGLHVDDADDGYEYVYSGVILSGQKRVTLEVTEPAETTKKIIN